MIYTFDFPIRFKNGSVNKPGDPIIIDDINSKDETAEAVREALKKTKKATEKDDTIK